MILKIYDMMGKSDVSVHSHLIETCRALVNLNTAWKDGRKAYGNKKMVYEYGSEITIVEQEEHYGIA